MNILDEAAKVAGSITTILALLALVCFNPIKNWIKAKREKKAKEKAAQKEADDKEREEAANFRKEVRQSINEIIKSLHDVTEDIGDLQYERLSQAQDFYTSRGWCTGAKKEMLCKMHASYRAKGRNHLSKHYEQEILELPDKPPEIPLKPKTT